MADTDFRALCAELTGWIERSTRHYINDPGVLIRARAALADEPAVPQGRKPASVTGQPSDEELESFLVDVASQHGDIYWAEPLVLARAVLARWGTPNLAETRRSLGDGEVAELTGKLVEAAPALAEMGWDQHAQRILRAAELLQRQALVPEAAAKPRKCLIEPPSWCDDGQAHAWQAGWEARDDMLLQPWPPVSVSDALIKAECALADIAEGAPMTDEGDPLQWAERRCADTLAIIRPTMRQYGIPTSEWPPVPAHALPLPEVGK